MSFSYLKKHRGEGRDDTTIQSGDNATDTAFWRATGFEIRVHIVRHVTAYVRG